MTKWGILGIQADVWCGGETLVFLAADSLLPTVLSPCKSGDVTGTFLSTAYEQTLTIQRHIPHVSTILKTDNWAHAS